MVLTTCDQETYVAEALDSALGQTLVPFEILVCDDASVDGTRAIIETYRDRYPALVKPVYQERRLGVAGNRNAGLDRASGDLITFMAADDFIHPEKFEKETAALRDHPDAAWAYSVVERIDDAGNSLGLLPGTAAGAEGDIFEDVLLRRVSPRFMMMRRSLVDTVGPVDTTLELYEDWDFKIRLAREGRVVHVPEALSVYRVHDGGLHTAPRRVHMRYLERVAEKAFQRLAASGDGTADRYRAALDDVFLRHWIRYACLERDRGEGWKRLLGHIRRRGARIRHVRFAAMLVLPRFVHRMVRGLKRGAKGGDRLVPDVNGWDA